MDEISHGYVAGLTALADIGLLLLSPSLVIDKGSQFLITALDSCLTVCLSASQSIRGQLITSINAQHVAVWGWTDNPSKDWGFIKAKSATHTNTYGQAYIRNIHMRIQIRTQQLHTHIKTGTHVKTRILSQTNLLLSGS